MIKPYIENAIKQIEAEKEKQANIVKERVTREKIVPFNTEIDVARDKAIAELTNQMNNSIKSAQDNFNQKKKELIEAGEAKKKENAETVTATEVALVTLVYDKAIMKLTEQVEELKE